MFAICLCSDWLVFILWNQKVHILYCKSHASDYIIQSWIMEMCRSFLSTEIIYLVAGEYSSKWHPSSFEKSNLNMEVQSVQWKPLDCRSRLWITGLREAWFSDRGHRQLRREHWAGSWAPTSSCWELSAKASPPPPSQKWLIFQNRRTVRRAQLRTGHISKASQHQAIKGEEYQWQRLR